MRRLFHNSMIIIGLLAVLISFSGLFAEPTDELDVSDSNDISMDEVDEIVTVAQHENQLEEQNYSISGPLEYSTYQGVTIHSDHSGIILWEDPNGVEHETAFAVKDGIVEFVDEDVIRSVDRSRFVSMVIHELKGDEAE